MSDISISQLNHSYNSATPESQLALQDISLNIADGEFIALVGPSGSGKTTLLRALAGFIRPLSGRITLGGRTLFASDIWVPPHRRQLGMVFQDHAVWPHMSVSENVAYPLKRAGLRSAEISARVEKILEHVGLVEFAQRKPTQLSGGQRQRVALARAIVAEPSALLLDEALSALDEPLRARLRLELRRLTTEQGLTAVHVTHDRSEALAIADRVVVMDQGRIVQVGTASQMTASPASSFVAGFLNDATLFPGSISSGRFYPDHPGVNLYTAGTDHAPAKVSFVDGVQAGAGRQRAIASVDPYHIRLESVSQPDGDDVQVARVTSILQGRDRTETALEWGDTEVRVFGDPDQPVRQPGELVRPVIQSAHVYLN
ncbi:ABC transporter ATP-binding protein [Auritidibacter sp. NML120779]|nr:ABC transporter ATP-binding protein [Auritidibacter sp. NML120779]